MNFKKGYLLLLILLTSQISLAQEGMSVYSDYLTDNYYLLHPSMAGASNCAKIRFTGRQQWFDNNNAPTLSTLSFNGRIGERSGAGIILYNDQNGYHSQKGVKLTYAHHLMFSRSELDLNQLSFGANVNFAQSQLDETSFLNQPPDPLISGIIQKSSYFNIDLGASYYYLDFYTHLTVQNVLGARSDFYTAAESSDKRRLLLSLGYVFGHSDALQWEPSVLFSYEDETKQKFTDLNLKLYKDFDNGKIWGGLSYRRAFDQVQYQINGTTSSQRLQYLTPILGINYKRFMFAYTYSQVFGDVKFDNAGFHQITLGMNLWCKRERYDCNCPAIN